MMAALHADHLFLSTVGLDGQCPGRLQSTFLEAQLNSRMVQLPAK